MSIRRKLFLMMASMIVGMGIIFALMTQFVVNGILNAMLDVDRSQLIEQLSDQFIRYYQGNHGSWSSVQDLPVRAGVLKSQADASYVLLTPHRQVLYSAGPAEPWVMFRLGVRHPVTIDGKTVAQLFYYDLEVANHAKLRIGIRSSITFLLLLSAVVFVLIALFIAYLLSKKLSAPLKQLIPAIDRLSKGQFGVQVPVLTRDEFGLVAQTFNDMSLQLKRAEEVRKNMAADVAHELRTPLTIIRGKLELIQHSGQSVEPESLLPLQDELIRLTKLVDDLHQLSLAEARKLPLERKPTDLTMLLQRVIDHLSPSAEEKGIQLGLDCRTESTTLSIDPNRMTQVFLNLLVNAIRYTSPGGKVSVTIEEELISGVAAASASTVSSGSRVLKISVADTGSGIDPEQLPHLFHRFYRTDEARDRNSGGMGLGLAIAKEFVSVHGGSIEAESLLGEGSTFVVRLPYETH
jgi:two-component system, OmpR family, sensor histidine kinase BaeS